MIENTQKIKDAAKEAISTADVKALTPIMMQPFEKVTKQERVALWVLRLSVLFYGFALTIFTIIGLRQMLR